MSARGEEEGDNREDRNAFSYRSFIASVRVVGVIETS